MKIYNTLGRKIEEFSPIKPGEVGIYSCGPTVYFYQSIGNFRAYLFVDTLKRAFLYMGYKVNHITNITDVGHLTSDEDHGEDKLEKAAKKEKRTVWDVANFYTEDYLASLDRLNIVKAKVYCRATEHIPQQIEMIQKLLDNGLAYVTKSGIYYDVTKFNDYTKLSGQNLDDNMALSREDVVEDKNKRHPYDFRLWQLDDPDHQMLWDSPWGKGYPGWHIECSAMASYYLGQPFDIHIGGMEHIGVHHTNEIAQAEGANRVKFVNYWMHNEFLTINGGKMGKSLGNAYTLDQIDEFLEKYLGFKSNNSLMALRYLYLTSHYRNKLDFSLESLYSSFSALFSIYRYVGDLYLEIKDDFTDVDLNILQSKKINNKWIDNLLSNINNNLEVPSVLADLNKLIAELSVDSMNEKIEKFNTILEYDKILGLRIYENTVNYIFNFSEEEKELIDKRTKSRENKDYKESDILRNLLSGKGIDVLDSLESTKYYKK